MDIKLLELQTRELLKKFGAGDHKPGSGSAAAYLGLLSARLLLTVITLTDKPKHAERYKDWLPKLKEIGKEIDERVLPKLEQLFQKDSEIFDGAILARQARNREKDPVQKNLLITKATEDLKPATITPIEIAKLCIELADFAEYVFLHGFKSARGDAGVAQNAAIAATGGCLSIVYLNLLSFDNDSWSDVIRKEADDLQQVHRNLSAKAIDYIGLLRAEASRHAECKKDMNTFLASVPAEGTLTDAVIESIAARFQKLLLKHKNVVWKFDESVVDIAQPDVALKAIGYQFYTPDFLEHNDTSNSKIEVAGLIDKEHKYVQVSRAFTFEIQNFTAAHELGHALLHNQSILHRDRPLDGSSTSRDKREIQADKFAVYFLMPQDDVISDFKNLYKIDKFRLDQNTVFNLTRKYLDTFKKEFPNRRAVSSYLAVPLADNYNVSVTTMAIRLEELDLVDY